MATSVRVRMYRTGFGDCFLVSFGAATSRSHVLIDFGAHMHGEIGTMDSIIDNIESETEKKLALIVATHAHRDHISGFGKFGDRFAQFKIGEVWMPWTDNPKDTRAAALERKHKALYDVLDRHLRVALKASEDNPQYTAALHALSNLRGNEEAKSKLGRAFDTGAPVRYLQAGVSIADVGATTGLSAEILSPSIDKEFFTRMDPPRDQRFLAAPGDMIGAVHPFPNLEIRYGDPDYLTVVQEGQPLVLPSELPGLSNMAEAQADRLALALDNVRNNTSLVIVFRFQGKSLLFPGDAQWGNWQSWIGTDSARQLLSEIDFFKVAHHGSENATPVDVVRSLKETGLATMVSTQVEPFPTIPRMPLLDALGKRCLGQVAVRSDWIKVANAPTVSKPDLPLPQGFTHGEFWIDYQL